MRHRTGRNTKEVAREPSVGGHSTAGSARSHAGRGRTVPALSLGRDAAPHPGTCLCLNGAVPRTGMAPELTARCPGRGWPAPECELLPLPGMCCSQYICLRVVQVGSSVHGSSCVSGFQG